MGERVPVGHLAYTVFDRQWQNQLGAGVDARQPQNRFYLVRVNATNNSSDELIIPNTELVDDSGKTYPEETNGDGVQDWLGNTRQVAGSQTAQGYLLFDVPPKHYKLRVTGEENQHAALVDIPLSFDSDAPDIGTQFDVNKLPAKK
jgi:hypothetical protein